tara:strand:+ start:38917 stop:39876 length:960 start_codon:yes stop_codon:yes gene_type:complete
LKVLIADKFPSFAVNKLLDDGHVVELKPELMGDSLSDAMDSAEILVVRSTPVSASIIDASQNLKLIVRAGAGTNTIDKQFARKKSISVCNVPGKNAAAVAELVIGLMIAIDRQIPDNVFDLRADRWNKKQYAAARGLYQRSLGVIGLGAVGIAVLERAVGFGLKLHVVKNPNRPDSIQSRLTDLNVEMVADIDMLIQSCDVISVHVPSNSKTHGMIDAQFLKKLKPGTILINTSRGDIIDEDALIQALDKQDLRVGLDVYCNEPLVADGEFKSAVARHKSVYGTHHIGASTLQAQNAVAEGVLEVIEAFGRGVLPNCVN